jgi:hypothetical protein
MKLRKLALAFLAAAFVTAGFTGNQAQGAHIGSPIDGAITFSGGAVYDTMSLATATRVSSFTTVTVDSRDGEFASFVNVGDTVTMAEPYIFTPSTPTPGLWSVGGFTFDLDSSTVESQSANFLTISGIGTISGNGYADTAGTWSFTSQSPAANGVFSFSAGSAGSGGSVPDGGTTVALLGLALAGIEIVRRKLATA